MTNYNFAAIVQIRRGATRLPDKVFQNIGDLPLIEHVVFRLKASKSLNDVIVATTTNPLDDKIEDWCVANDVSCHRGSENDVLLRYLEAARKFNVVNIVRACGDNPFVDLELIDLLVESHKKGTFDLTNDNVHNIIGSGVEVFTTSALEKSEKMAKKRAYREHVTPYFYDHPQDFRLNFIESLPHLSGMPLRITIDTEQDLELCRNVYNNLSEIAANSENGLISTKQVVEYLRNNPEVVKINQEIQQKNLKDELEMET